MSISSSGFFVRLSVAAFVATALAIVAPSASAQNWKATGYFGWFGVGKAHQIEEGHFYWVGEFSGTFFSDEGKGGLFHLAGVKCPAWFELDFNKDKANGGGYCIVTDLDGDQAYLRWEEANVSAKLGSPGPGTFEYTGGTGKYNGISGKNRFAGVTQVNWSDGTSSGYATWNR
ncbi:MAG TPA: hypothetical protein VMW70_06585 [Burkholderiales bacterium]|nr:hypothetical protein [Burkholderiales bacterium]